MGELVTGLCLVALVGMMTTRLVLPAVQRARRSAGEGLKKTRTRIKAITEGGKKSPATPAADPPTFRVVALGVAGSGKTVLLASMWRELHVQTNARPYYLETPLDQAVYLGDVFAQVVDPAAPWPPGTQIGDTREFTFDCVVPHDVKHHVMRINYLDYAGEILESAPEAGSTALRDLQSHIEQAHALLGILDGNRVREYLRREPKGLAYLRADILPMLGAMARASCPIQLVLTKWDIVKDFGEPVDADDNVRLRIVRDTLLADPQISALVRMHHGARRTVRLIPVSAVGRDFAQVRADGQVVKRRDGELDPINLEVPLSAVLPDLFGQIDASLSEESRRQLDDRLKSLRGMRPQRWASAVATFIAQASAILLAGSLGGVLGGPLAGAQAHPLILPFLDWMATPFVVDTTRVKRDEAKNLVAGLEEARGKVVKEFEHTLWYLERRLPASRLSGG